MSYVGHAGDVSRRPFHCEPSSQNGASWLAECDINDPILRNQRSLEELRETPPKQNRIGWGILESEIRND